MKKIFAVVTLFSLLLMVQVGCDKKSTVDNGKVLANINGYKLTQTKLDAILKAIPPQAAAKFKGEAGQKQLIEQYTQQKLLVQYAKKLGVDNSPEYAARKEIMEDELTLEFFYKDFSKKNEANDVVLKSYLEKNPNVLKSEESFTASHILVSPNKDQKVFNSKKSDAKNEKEAQKILKMLQKKLAKGAKFEDLAKQYSEGPSAPRGGDLGTFKPGQMVKAFDDALKTMKPGEISDIVKTRFGYHLIYLKNHSVGNEIKFETLTDQQKKTLKGAYLKNLLTQKLDELKKEATITVK